MSSFNSRNVRREHLCTIDPAPCLLKMAKVAFIIQEGMDLGNRECHRPVERQERTARLGEIGTERQKMGFRHDCPLHLRRKNFFEQAPLPQLRKPQHEARFEEHAWQEDSEDGRDITEGL